MSKPHLPYTRDCFVCGEHNPHGLRLKFRRENGKVFADFTPEKHHAGFRNIVHGGILATILDEAMFWAAATATKKFCLAAELSVRFVKKVTVGQNLIVEAEFFADRGRLWESRAEIRDGKGTVFARGSCKQAPMSVAEMKHAAADFLPAADAASARDLFPDLAS
jgi:acyl-coenzyme A thioesterase PaaI-like protein